MSKNIDELLKLPHKLIDVVERARKNIVTLLRFKLEKSESWFGQVRFFAKKKEDENFQLPFIVFYKLEEIIYLLDLMNSVWKNLLLIHQFVMSYKKYLLLFTLHCFSSYSSRDKLEHWK